jgi:hypothetical protein
LLDPEFELYAHWDSSPRGGGSLLFTGRVSVGKYQTSYANWNNAVRGKRNRGYILMVHYECGSFA